MIDLSRVPPAPCSVDNKRLLATVTGIVAPQWHIKKQNQTQQGHRDRTVSWPALANISLYLAKASSVHSWNGLLSHYFLTLLGPISV